MSLDQFSIRAHKYRSNVCKACNRVKYGEQARAYSREYNRAHRDYFKQYYATYKERNSARLKQYRDHYNKEHAEEILLLRKAWLAKHPEKRKEYARRNRLRLANKLRTDPEYKAQHRIRQNLANRMRSATRGCKSAATLEILGCTAAEAKVFLERKFKPGMTWENYGEWHIDHIRPCTSFDLTKVSEQKQCFHYTNLQPLWALENILKSNK